MAMQSTKQMSQILESIPGFRITSIFYVKHRSRVLKGLYFYLLITLFASTISVKIDVRKKFLKWWQTLSSKEKIQSPVKSANDGKIKNMLELLYTVADKNIVRILILQVATIFCKIYLNLKMIGIDSKLVSSLFGRKFKKFAWLIVSWLALGVPISVLYAFSGYLTANLAKNLVKSLSDDMVGTYLSSSGKSSKDNLNALYKINHLSSIINDPHQRISVDIFEFSNNLSTLPSLILNPFLDLAVFSNKLFNYDNGAMTEVTLLFGLIVNVSTFFIKLASPGFSRIANTYSKLESDFRQVHSNIMNHCEQIALLRSWDRELYDADSYYFILERFLKRNYRKFALYNFVKTFVIKYTWGALGLGLCAFPVFKGHFQVVKEEESTDKITQDFIQNRSLLMNASNAMGELLSSKKNVDQMAGTAQRIIEFKNALSDLMDDQANEGISSAVVIHDNNMIKFEDVPLSTPSGQLLKQPLNLSISTGDNLLIVGPNGSGKSSLFRLLSGLWPAKSGTLTIPEYNSIFYLPQRPYLVKGKTNLIEQIIYPKSYHTFQVELTLPGVNTREIYKELIEILKSLELDSLLLGSVYSDGEEGGLSFDTLKYAAYDSDSETSDEEGNNYEVMMEGLLMEKDWSSQLSMGSQQKLAMARLYYHKPRFAVLDECTSQVTPEMEDKMYSHATKDLNITVLSVAHRTSIWKFHQYLLQFDGKGGYLFKKFDYGKRLKLVEEKMEIEKQLNHIPQLKARLQELYIVRENQLKKV